MALSNIGFENISERDLIEQVTTGVPEGVLLDYKRDMYGRSDADAKEFLKDVSSFANTDGGHLIIGVDEAAGIPTAVSALNGDPDQDLQRLENLARDGIEPRIAGLRMKALPISGGGYVLILRVPKSWNPPHRISARNTNRIYGRNSAGAYEFSVDELRVVFTLAASALDRVRAFRAERLAKIDSGEAIVTLAQNCGRLVLHLVPTASFGLRSQVDLEKAYAAQQLLRPMGAMGYTPCINFDGFSNLHHGADGNCWSYTQVFRNGAIEAVKVRVVSDLQAGNLWIPTLDFDRWIFEQLPNYLAALQSLDVPPPIILMITLQGVRGARLGVWPTPLDDLPTIDRDVLELPEIIIEQYGTDVDYQRTAKPAFDALWNTGGFTRSKHFDATGKWVPPRN
ncbi:MAG: AlbA family DNA-binding domain-containing protein [Pseudolabrys sp.]